MAIVNLMDLQPTVISRDLKDKYLLLYSRPKIGKTEFAAQCPGNLIFCFEKGVNFRPGIFALNVPTWTDFKVAAKQLRKPEVKEKFNTITMDTVTIAWDLCKQHICSTNGVSAIGDIPYGKGYALLSEEFSSTLREISMLGYGVILIAHAKITTIKLDDDKVVEKVAPDIPDRAQSFINAFVDIIGYIDRTFDENEKAVRTLVTKETPYIVAGSRSKYLPERIPFGYNELVDAIYGAIEKEALAGATVVDKQELQGISSRSFDEAMAEARELWGKLVGETDENNCSIKILNAAETIFGRPIRLSEIQPAEQALFEELIEEMKKM